MRYTLVTGANWEKFIKNVNNAITNGWRPQGAPFPIYNEIVYVDSLRKRIEKVYAQAMIKPQAADN